MIIYMGIFRAIADLFRGKKEEPVPEGGEGKLNLLDEQGESQKQILRDGGWKCYTCGLANPKLTVNCTKCGMGKYESEDLYKADAIRKHGGQKKKREKFGDCEDYR